MDGVMNPIVTVQKHIADLFRNEPWFAAHNVKVIEQNSQELYYLLRTKLDELRGVSLVVGVDGMTGGLQTGLEQKITVTATELVTINRAKQGFATAIDAVCAAIQVLDFADWGDVAHAYHFIDMRHEAARDVDILRATATFGVIANRIPCGCNT